MISDKTGESPFGSSANPDPGRMINPDSSGGFGGSWGIGVELMKPYCE
jgi:hypothetical protein